MNKISFVRLVLVVLVFIGCGDTSGLNNGNNSNSGYSLKEIRIDGILVNTYYYNDKRQLTKSIRDNKTTTYFYNNKEKLEKVSYRGKITTFSYNIKGQLVKLDGNGEGTILYFYNDKGQLAKSNRDDEFIITYSYNDKGQLIKATHNNNEIDTYSYNDKGQLIRLGGKRQSINYVYNSIGQLIKTNSEDHSYAITYTYEPKSCSARFELIFIALPSELILALCKK